VIGDFAWCFENLLNHLLNGTVVAVPAIADLLDEATTGAGGAARRKRDSDQALTHLPGLTPVLSVVTGIAGCYASVDRGAEAEAPIKPVAIEAPTPEALPVEGVVPVETAIPEPVMTRRSSRS